MSVKSQTPICPKCGYDQSGKIATWSAQCPTQGQCSECGLEFDWANIFDPTRTRLPWYAEHATTPWQFIRRTPPTLIRLLQPHRFWKSVDITKDLCPKRLILWVLFVMLLAHLLVSVPNGMYARNMQNWNQTTITQHYQMYKGYGIAEIIIDAIAFPYFNALPEAYSFKWSIFIERGWPDAWYEEFFKHIGFQLGFLFLWLLVIFVIPSTKKIAKVRSAHVIRTGALSLLMIFLSVELLRFTRLMYQLTSSNFDIFTLIHQWIVPVAILWQVVFWSCAVSIAWKVKRWKLLVILGTIAALLGGQALNMYTFLALQG